MLRFPVLCLVMGATVCPAAELVLREVSLGVTAWPGSFDWTLASANVNASGSDGFDAGGALDLGGRWSFARPGAALGLIASADMLVLGMSYGDGDGLAMVGGRIGGGGGWALADRWTVSSEVGVGFGATTMKFPATLASTGSSVSGTTTFFDIHARLTWNVTRSWSVAGTLGYVNASHSLSGDGSDIDIDQAGLTAGILISWRISDLPAGLE